VTNPDELALFERLVRIEAKLDSNSGTHADHETRIRKLERAVWLATGFAAAGGGLVGQLVAQFMQ
jgi:hypothetical protein